MLPDDILGRYEFHSDTTNSHKFWHVYYDERTRSYTCEWGRCGRVAQKRKPGMTEAEARKKISEKVNKGYQHTGSGIRSTASRNVGGSATPTIERIHAKQPTKFKRKLNIQK